MADTARTIADLLVLFADNASGDISEQDCRDLIVTFVTTFGSMYMENNATATTIAALGTWHKVAGTTTEGPAQVEFTMPANNRLTYSDTITRHTHILGFATITCGSNNQVGEMAIHKNGTIIPGSTVGFKCLSAGDPITVPLLAETGMAPTDYIEAFILNATAANDMTVTYFKLRAEGNVH